MTNESPEKLEEVGEFTYNTAEEMPDEIKDVIYKEWLPRVVAGLIKAARELPAEHRDHVLQGMSDGCGPMACAVCGIKPEWSKEEYIKNMSELPPPLGPRTIDWVGDIIQVDYQIPTMNGQPICQCPLVMLNMIEPFPELCICSANVGAYFIEAYTQQPTAKVELIGSPHSGLKTCQYRVHLKPALSSTPRGCNTESPNL